MTVLDKVVAAITPEPGDEKIAETRAAAQAMASGVGWLTMVLDHHDEIEAAFAAVKGATTITRRRTAQKALGLILTGIRARPIPSKAPPRSSWPRSTVSNP